MPKNTTREVIDQANFVDNDPSADDSGEPVRLARKQVPKQQEYAWGYRSDKDGQARTDYVGVFKESEVYSDTNNDRIIGTFVAAYTNFNEEEGFVSKTTFDSENVKSGSSQPFPVVDKKLEHPHYLDVYFIPRRMEDGATDTLDSGGLTIDISDCTLFANYSKSNK
jgi:hypothetical protein